MALHRDIYWVGRQWAVTGLGVQAVDQRLKGAFDIEVAQLWDDDLPQRMRALAWLKADDFDKALEIARARHPEPPRKNLPLVESILEMIPPGGRGEAPKPPASPMAARLPPNEPPSLPRSEARAPPSNPQNPAVPSIGVRPASAPKAFVETPVPAVDPPKAVAASIEASLPPVAPSKPPVAPLPPGAPASRPPTRMVMGSKPAPPPAAPPKPPVAPIEGSVSVSKPKPLVATPIEASVRVSRLAKRLVAMIEPAPAPAAPLESVAAPVDTEAPVGKLDAVEAPPAKFQPLALRIEHASAKFLPRWRVRN